MRILRCFSERRQKILHGKFQMNVRVRIAALDEMRHTVMFFDDQSLNVMPDSLSMSRMVNRSFLVCALVVDLLA